MGRLPGSDHVIPRIDLPALIERGRDTAVSLDVYSDAGVQQSPSAATVVLYDGSEVVQTSVAATTVGPPISYTVPAATHAIRSLSSDWLAVWTVTISGVDYVFRQPVYLVRHVLYPVIIDTDLTDVHSDLDALRDSANMASFEPLRSLAWSRIQRRLIARGNRTSLVMDPWALKDLHVFETLALVFAAIASSLGDSRYAELAEQYRTDATSAWNSLVFRYDADENGAMDSSDIRRGAPVVYLAAPKWRT
jgi:hypothetical protein